MSKSKWGESFLKSGLPLEHLTVTKFRSVGFNCLAHIQYSRQNREGDDAWFEFDIEATSKEKNIDTYLNFLVECKYHDQSRFWFFLPQIHKSIYESDGRVLNCGPLQTLSDPEEDNFLKLAPRSMWGVVVSADGQQLDNTVNTAVQQLVNGFVQYSLDTVFLPQAAEFSDSKNQIKHDDPVLPSRVKAFVPMIVTNASIFRLKPSVIDLDDIRNADSPNVIADELDWTWCFHDVPLSLSAHNGELIANHNKTFGATLSKFRNVLGQMNEFSTRPNWIAVVNVRALEKTVKEISEIFLGLHTKSMSSLLRKK